MLSVRSLRFGIFQNADKVFIFQKIIIVNAASYPLSELGLDDRR